MILRKREKKRDSLNYIEKQNVLVNFDGRKYNIVITKANGQKSHY